MPLLKWFLGPFLRGSYVGAWRQTHFKPFYTSRPGVMGGWPVFKEHGICKSLEGGPCAPLVTVVCSADPSLEFT